MAEIGRSDGGGLVDQQAIIANSQAQIRTQQANDTADDHVADGERRSAEKHLRLKMLEIKKEQAPQRESFSRNDPVQQRFEAAQQGKLGPEVAAGARGWQNAPELQQKLTQVQKRLFQEAFLQNPTRGAQAGAALAQLSVQPGFNQAVVSSQQMGAIQQEVLEAPQLAQPLENLLQTPFMRSKGADPATKSDFLRFGMQQMKAGQTPALRQAGDMLGTLSTAKLPGFAQRAAMQMVQRNPLNATGMKNVDSFVQAPQIKALPTFARGTATTLLAKADGSTEIKDGFEKLAQDPTFAKQTNANKGRFFSTVGSGRSSELRMLTDKALVALRSPGFPAREAQVSRFLGKMAGVAARQGADSVDVEPLMESSRTSGMPEVPALISTKDLSPQDAKRAQSHNRSQLIKYYTAVSRRYEALDKQLTGAKYAEDINNLPGLREAESPDAEALSPEDKLFMQERQETSKNTLERLQGLKRRRIPELAGRRQSPRQRAAKLGKRRALGQQPRYFSPRTGQSTAGRASTTWGAKGSQAPTLPGQGAPRSQQAPGGRAEAPQRAPGLPLGPQALGRSGALPGGFRSTPLGGATARPARLQPSNTAAGRPLRDSGLAGRTAGRASGGVLNAGGPTSESIDPEIEKILSQLPAHLSPSQKMAAAKKALAQRWQLQMQQVIDHLIDAPPPPQRGASKQGAAAARSEGGLLPQELSTAAAREAADPALRGGLPTVGENESPESAAAAAAAAQAAPESESAGGASATPAGKTGADAEAAADSRPATGAQTPADSRPVTGAQTPADSRPVTGARTPAENELAGGSRALPVGDPALGSVTSPAGRPNTASTFTQRPQTYAKAAAASQAAGDAANLPPPNAAQASASLQALLRQSLAPSSTTAFAPVEAVEGATQERSAKKAAGRRAAAAAQTDGYGIPRRFERDLGGTQPSRIVKPAATAAGSTGSKGAEDAEPEVPADAAYTGRALIRPTTPIRDVEALFALKWVEMTRPEGALLRNMGWTQPTWDSRNEPQARWPQSMRTPFVKQGQTQRESIRKMGFTDTTWDDYVSQF
jgi:hypothetical protein